jgi:hypothetical protein
VTEQPREAPDKRVTSEPIEDDEGHERRIAQQPNNSPDELGGGEWPDPDTPPRESAPGTR